jgi:hypothetical protein
MHIGDINSETIERAQFEGKEFEDFVRLLLRHERELRHRRSAKVYGGAARYRGDQKRDLRFIVEHTPLIPREDFDAPLTWDEIGEVWYSCKGGRNWRQTFLNELGRSAAKSQKPPSSKIQLRPPEVLLDHLSKGRRFAFVIAEGTVDDAGFLDEIEGVLGWWLDQTRGGRPSNLRAQFEFIDANALADFISTHKPSNLSENIRKALGIDVPSGFVLWQQWTDELGGRDLPTFEVDPKRAAIFDAISDRSKRVIRVFGPPGAGKTRVVYEGIRRLGTDEQARVRCGTSLDASYDIRNWLRKAGRVYVVLDELRTVDVDAIVPLFEANASAGARLFLIGTSDDGTRPEPGRAFDLDKLDDDAIDRMIGHEYGRQSVSATSEQLAVIRKLSENYPWYAVLLARALAKEPESVERGDDEGARWNFGARRVLAGRPDEYGSSDAWDREAVLRAKCLLVAMMTRDLEHEWDEIWALHGAGLAEAIDEPREWDKVKEREKVCRDRQILRESGIRAKRRYVSPNNLARLILHRFFTDPDLGPGLRRHTPEFRGSLLAIAISVRAKPAVIDKLARGEWDELRRRAENEGIDSVGDYLRDRNASYLAALEVPEVAARATSLTLLGFDVSELATASGVRSVLRGILTHVIHRALSTDAFLQVEAALVHLAQIEDESWANNAAGVWKSLFLPGLHCTHQPWIVRLERLDQRLSDEDLKRRGLAIDALCIAVDPREMGLGYVEADKRDGEWPNPTVAEFREMKNQLWTRLLDACSDSEKTLADRARHGVSVRIRSGLGRGLYAPEIDRLGQLVSNWTLEQRQALADAIAEIRRWDMDDFIESKFAGLTNALGELEAALAPTDLRSRLVAQFGTWSPGPWQLTHRDQQVHEQAADRQLARELLEHPEAHDWALGWLLSSLLTHRGFHAFRALGFVDESYALRARIVDIVYGGAPPQVLAEYLHGRADAEGPDAVESWIAGHIDERKLASAFGNFLIAQEPSEQRLERLRELLRNGASGGSLTVLVHRGWFQRLEVEQLVAFVRGILPREELSKPILLMIVTLLDREISATQRELLLDWLQQVLAVCSTQERVGIALQSWFTQGVLALADAGRFESVATIIVQALDTAGEQTNVGVGHGILRTLLDGGHGEQLWPQLAEAMLKERSAILPWQLARDNLIGYVDADSVLAWVGFERRRGQIVAALANPHAATLNEVTRQLLIRFGPDGDVARVLSSRAWSTPGAVAGGIPAFERRQLENARRWSEDSHPKVRAWAQRLEEEFQQSVEEHEARAEFQRKYG